MILERKTTVGIYIPCSVYDMIIVIADRNSIVNNILVSCIVLRILLIYVYRFIMYMNTYGHIGRDYKTKYA